MPGVVGRRGRIPVSTFVRCFIVLALLLTTASSASGGLIYESAISGPTLQTGGSGTSIDSSFYTAVNFQVTSTVTTGSIGAHMSGFSTNPVFGAIVALTGQFDFPDSANLSTPDVLGFTLITAPNPSDNRAGNLRLTLTPGWYALVFGSNQFGATGSAGALGNNIANGSQMIYTIRQSDGAINFQSSVCRLFIDSTPVPTFTKIADTTTLIPNTASVFTAFSQPSIRDGAVAFRAGGPAGQTSLGVYTNAGGSLRTVANLGTSIPNGTNVFTSFGTQVSLSQGVVAFKGLRSSAPTQEGLYTDTSGTLAKVVDRNTPIPGGTGNLTSYGLNLTIDQGQVAFAASGSGDQQGIFRHDGSTLHVVARDGTPIPGQLFAFDNFFVQYVGLDAGKTLFRGVNEPEVYIGIFTDLTGPLTRVIDNAMPLPGAGVNFFFASSPILRNGKMAFVAADDVAAPTVACIYSDAGGALAPLVCFGDPAPSIGGTLSFPQDTAFNGRNIAFRGTNNSNIPAVFTNIGGELMKTIARNDVLDNKIVNTPSISIEAIDGNSIAFLTTFTNGSSGIYVATYPDLNVPGDIDADGDLDGDDITAFVAVLLGSPLDADHILRCDMNSDGTADGRDVNGFTDAYLN